MIQLKAWQPKNGTPKKEGAGLCPPSIWDARSSWFDEGHQSHDFGVKLAYYKGMVMDRAKERTATKWETRWMESVLVKSEQSRANWYGYSEPVQVSDDCTVGCHSSQNSWFSIPCPLWTRQVTCQTPHGYDHVQLPSGKLTKHNYGKSPFLLGKSTINGNVQQLC